MIGLLRRPLSDNTQLSLETFMPLTGFEPAIPVSERPKTHAVFWFFSGVASIESMGLAVLLSVYSRASAYTGKVVYLTKIACHVLPERYSAKWRL
jgi:ABC-type transporter Mla MlaB component